MVGVSEETLSRELKTSPNKALCLEREREAKRVSLLPCQTADHARFALTGQAESGKSTMLQNLHPYFAPSVIHAEAEAWRAVIHLNRFHYVNYILSGLASMSSGVASSGAVTAAGHGEAER
ncbi:hypothetical protein A0H81_10972 [Grifola frondosa]|uniref:Uncharacterized protein n=1 Tax=Grifola frondosa TaxID=5627 RepID=A0A1C7M289_GRIFR|nr:hypothetical protein A0H81_10972 [Grifola frondosa]